MSGGLQKAGAAVGKVTSAVAGTKQTMKELLSGGGWRVVHDGNLMQTLLLKSPQATLVGIDVLGNKYFEDMSLPSGQHRWVLFADKHKLSGEDPTTVPAEWHGWLHFITDRTPSANAFDYPIYTSPAVWKKSVTGTSNRYLPKGAWTNPQRRHWQKFTAWSPAGHTSVRGAVPDSA